MTKVGGTPFEIQLNAGHNPERYPSVSNESCYNLFEFDGSMMPTAGFMTLLEGLGGETVTGRGIFYSDTLDKCVAVIGNVIFAVTDTTHVVLGLIDTFVGKVFFAENGLKTEGDPASEVVAGQVAISDGVNIYVFVLGIGLEIAKNDQGDPLEFVPGTVAFQNDFFFVNDLDSNNVHSSAINNALVWPTKNRNTATGKTTSCIAFKNLLYVFTQDRTNIFYGDRNRIFFPYSQDTSRAWEFGCLSQGSVASGNGRIAWLGTSRYAFPTVLLSTGGTPQTISTEAIESIINSLTKPLECEGFLYEQLGHYFYQLNFFIDNVSLLYDFNTTKWTRLSDFTIERLHPIRQTTYYQNKNLVLGILRKTGRIVNFSIDTFTHDGDIVPRSIITKNYEIDERPHIIKEIDLQIEQGENQNTSKICLSISKDRGRTYPIQQVKELNSIGFRKELLRFRRMGYARWWTFKFDFFSQDRFVILKATGYIRK